MLPFYIALAIGTVAGFFVPADELLGASAELIAFVALIMAGLLPAMILTATALRGDAFSTARVREYGEGLRRQLRFWAVLFAVSLICVLSICLAKVFDAKDLITLAAAPAENPWTHVPVRVLIMVGVATLIVVLVRLWPAYKGLRSLLEMTITMAEVQALANDRSFSDALSAKTSRIAAAQVPVETVDWSPTIHG